MPQKRVALAGVSRDVMPQHAATTRESTGPSHDEVPTGESAGVSQYAVAMGDLRCRVPTLLLLALLAATTAFLMSRGSFQDAEPIEPGLQRAKSRERTETINGRAAELGSSATKKHDDIAAESSAHSFPRDGSIVSQTKSGFPDKKWHDFEKADDFNRSCLSPGLPLFPPLKVFMYDLPAKFNLDLARIDRNSRGHSETNTSVVSFHTGLHPAELWMYLDLIQPGKSKASSACLPAAVRVTNPEEADVFYVPIFSTLASRKQVRASVDVAKLQAEFVAWLHEQVWWRRHQGWDHVIPMQHPLALKDCRQSIKSAILLVCDFGRTQADEAFLEKDVICPYKNLVPALPEVADESSSTSSSESHDHDDSWRNRITLLFFRGTRDRRGDKTGLRSTLFKVLQSEPGVVMVDSKLTNRSVDESIVGFRTSQFCLHTAGDTPSSARLFDAIANLCVPLIVQDNPELPFTDFLDYEKFTVIVPTKEARRRGYISNLLRSEKIQRRLPGMYEELRRIRHVFQWEHQEGAVPHVWRMVATKLERIRTYMESKTNAAQLNGLH